MSFSYFMFALPVALPSVNATQPHKRYILHTSCFVARDELQHDAYHDIMRLDLSFIGVLASNNNHLSRPEPYGDKAGFLSKFSGVSRQAFVIFGFAYLSLIWRSTVLLLETMCHFVERRNYR